MKRIPFISFLLSIAFAMTSCAGSSKQENGATCDPDSIDVEASHMIPDSIESVAIGDKSIAMHIIKTRAELNDDNFYMDFDLHLTEQNAKITKSIFAYIHAMLLKKGLITKKDAALNIDVEKLVRSNKTFSEILEAAIQAWKPICRIPRFDDDDDATPEGFCITFNIHPVFLNEDYITYVFNEYDYAYGAHGDEDVTVCTYNVKTGDAVNLSNVVKSAAIDNVHALVAEHMASKFPVSADAETVEQYLDALNEWLDKPEDDRITLQNFPINCCGIHASGLVVTFEKYQLTPGACGSPIIVIPYSELKDCLQPSFTFLFGDNNMRYAIQASEFNAELAGDANS
jgi:hypothetical protein